MTDIDLGNTKMFLNQSLYPCYKLLWSKSKRLHAMKQTQSYYVSNGTEKVKIEGNGRALSIKHGTDFDKHVCTQLSRLFLPLSS